jgi:hypothetical protein
LAPPALESTAEEGHEGASPPRPIRRREEEEWGGGEGFLQVVKRQAGREKEWERGRGRDGSEIEGGTTWRWKKGGKSDDEWMESTIYVYFDTLLWYVS